jgi:hypothetical protein
MACPDLHHEVLDLESLAYLPFRRLRLHVDQSMDFRIQHLVQKPLYRNSTDQIRLHISALPLLY